MTQEVINALVNFGIALAVALVSSLVAFIIAKIRARLSEKELATFDEIAKIVESLYRGADSSDKASAFEDLCKAKKLNVERGKKYLETHIIPTSKAINTSVAPTQNDGETD